MKYNQSIITGSMSWDIIMDFPGRFVEYLQPDMLHQINVSFVVDNLEKQMGGTATNIAYALSQTKKILNDSSSNGKQDIYILGALGKDGREHLAFFRKNKIRTDGIVRDAKRYSASGSVITDKNDNQIWGFYYGACEKGKDAPYKKYAGHDSLMILSANHPEAFLAAQRHAVTKGIPYLYDVGMAMSWIKLRDLQEGALHAAYLVGNDYEINLITKTLKMTVQALTEKGVSVITTLGEKGVIFFNATDSVADFPPASARAKLRAVGEPLRPRHLLLEKEIYIPAVKMKRVVDPTGAGDAWRGGFMAALMAELPIEKCLAVGNTVASFAVEQYGTVNYTVSKKEFNRRLQNIISK